MAVHLVQPTVTHVSLAKIQIVLQAKIGNYACAKNIFMKTKTKNANSVIQNNHVYIVIKQRQTTIAFSVMEINIGIRHQLMELANARLVTTSTRENVFYAKYLDALHASLKQLVRLATHQNNFTQRLIIMNATASLVPIKLSIKNHAKTVANQSKVANNVRTPMTVHYVMKKIIL
jgi:hypothetical protein